MPSTGYSLGIDFGTSNTVAVVRGADGRTRTLLVDGSPLLPSAVFAEKDGTLVVGRDAVYSARLDPARFEPNPKRRVDEGTVLLGERELPVVELIAAVLARVVEECTRTVGPVDLDATLTCPAVWGATRREVLAEAARKAGLGDARLVVEPVAAATYFAQVLEKEVPVGSVVVVHDFGAGTFDASVVARTSSGFEVLAVDGRDDIGGIDVDAAVVGHLAKAYASRMPAEWARLTGPESVEDRRAKRQLWDDVRAAKERLSRHPTADLLIPLADVEAHLTRPELEAVAEPILAQTVRVTESVLRWANLAEGRIAGVFLVGGASRIPLMSTLLFRALGQAPVVLEQPELVVAEGSILAGALTVGVTAPAAPGPTTGLFPKIPADAWGPAGPPSVGRPGQIPPVPVSLAPAPPVPSAGAAAVPAAGVAVPVAGAAVPVAAVSTAAGAALAGAGSATAARSPAAAAAAAEAPPEVAVPVSPAPWVGRVSVPNARPVGGRAVRSAPIAATRPFPVPVVERPAPRTAYPPMPARPRAKPRRRGRRLRRALLFLFITLLLIAVPVIAGAVAYSLVMGEGFLPDRLVPAGTLDSIGLLHASR
jgi:molecular chaperone DnaK